MSSNPTSPTTTSTTVLGLTLNHSFIHTLFGRFCLAALVLNIICFICNLSQSVQISGTSGWYYFVCSSGFWFCLFEILFLICEVQNRIQVVPWKFGYLIIYGLWAFFYLTAASAATNIAANYGEVVRSWWACSFFGFIACIVYGSATYFRFMDWYSTRVAASSSTNQPA